MTRPAAAGLLIGATVALLVGIPAKASAKGAEVVRGYAVVTGPGLAHPIVFSAPWDRSMGGYYSEEAEDFLNFATFAGGIPGYVRPSARAPAAGSFGPEYEVVFFRDCCRLSVHQVVYPFAQGRPWVYTPPGQRRAMRRVFGRFWGGGASSGWAQAHQGLVVLLEQRGLPDEQPSPPGGAQTVPTQGSSLRGMLAIFAAFLAIGVALTVLRKRRT
jgi:hypothetical protein